MDRDQTKNIYAILGLTPGASKQAIKAVFRRLTMQYHPDRNPGNACIEQHFKSICNAYRVLMREANAQNPPSCTSLRQERRSHWRRTPSNRRYNWQLEEGYKGTRITTHA